MIEDFKTYIIRITPKGVEVSHRGQPVPMPETATKTMDEKLDVALHALAALGRDLILPATNIFDPGFGSKVFWVTTIPPAPVAVPEG